jgi:hypothetical protein
MPPQRRLAFLRSEMVGGADKTTFKRLRRAAESRASLIAASRMAFRNKSNIRKGAF